MSVDEEIVFYSALENNLKMSIEETYTNIFACEESIEGLLQIAPCLFTYAEFLLLLEDCRHLDSYSGKFENAVARMTSPVKVDDAIAINNTIRALEAVFLLLMDWIDKANFRVDAKQFDIGKTLLLQRVDEITGLKYNTIDYLELNDAMNYIFLVCRIKDHGDEDLLSDYGDFHVLGIKGFNTRAEANRYALANGISRQYVITRV